jgi:hypothetical protein
LPDAATHARTPLTRTPSLTRTPVVNNNLVQMAGTWPVYGAVAAFSMGLFAWDEHVLPNLQEAGWVTDLTYEGSLRNVQRQKARLLESPWATPLTASDLSGHAIQLPSVDALVEKPQFISMSQNGLHQHIRILASPTQSAEGAAESVVAELLPTTLVYREGDAVLAELPHLSNGVRLGAACMLSKEFTAFYGQDTWICKHEVDPNANANRIDAQTKREFSMADKAWLLLVLGVGFPTMVVLILNVHF